MLTFNNKQIPNSNLNRRAIDQILTQYWTEIYKFLIKWKATMITWLMVNIINKATCKLILEILIRT